MSPTKVEGGLEFREAPRRGPVSHWCDFLFFSFAVVSTFLLMRFGKGGGEFSCF